MLLDEIMGNAAIENSEIEYKARLNRENIEGWLKSVAGFANASGGEFFIGVEDKTHKLVGFTREKADAERNYFNNQVNEHIMPRPPYKVSFLCYTVRATELFILKIKVEESAVKPIIVKNNGVPAIYMRREGFTGPASYEEIISMSIKSQRASYDTIPSDEIYDKDKFSGLQNFCRKHNNGKDLSEKALVSLGFFDEKGRLANGAVLFQDGYDENKTAVQCAIFSGINRGDNRIVSINKFKGNITSTIGYIDEFIQLRMNHTVIKKENEHVTIDAFPKRALFEGIINAIAHRDYFMDGSQIQVDMFKDRLEISSPGSFYQSTKLGKTYDLTNIISKRRNELICGILVQCNVMEAAGTGFDKIAEEYRNADERHRPFINSASDHFTLVLPDLTYEKGIIDSSLPELSYAALPDGSAYDDVILRYCYMAARKSADIASFIGISDSSYFRKNILGKLADNNYLIKIKKGRSMVYITNREILV